MTKSSWQGHQTNDHATSTRVKQRPPEEMGNDVRGYINAVDTTGLLPPESPGGFARTQNASLEIHQLVQLREMGGGLIATQHSNYFLKGGPAKALPEVLSVLSRSLLHPKNIHGNSRFKGRQ